MRDTVLRALRDVTADAEISRQFEGEPGFKYSLLRFSEAARIYHYRPRRLHSDPPQSEPIRLLFEATLPGFSEEIDDRHRLDLRFDPAPAALGRICAIVGKNGTGKTSLLARLAASLWGLSRVESERLELRGPPIGRVIAVSYSALDAFERPPHSLSVGGSDRNFARAVMDNYRYCGFRDSDGTLKVELLSATFKSDFAEILRLGRERLWLTMIQQTRLDEDEPALRAVLTEERDAQQLADMASHLGAGHKTAFFVLTRLLASIRNGSLVLFDEPELNLHPSLLSASLRVLHGWLQEFDGYAVIGTHSPIALQEIPGRCVSIIRRVGRIPSIQVCPRESFGQSLSEIVGEVFALDERDINYATTLKELLDSGVSREALESSFSQPLSLNLRMTLAALTHIGGALE